MPDDIRIKQDMPSHPKTKKLLKRLGSDGFQSLLTLWCWAAANRPSGELSNMSYEDIEIAANWTGEDDKLVNELKEIKWLDDSDPLKLHDWEEHQPWVFGAEDRSKLSRLKKLSQVNRKKYQELKDNGVTGLTSAEYREAIKVKTMSDNLPTASQQLASSQPTASQMLQSASQSSTPASSLPFLSLPNLTLPNLTLPIKEEKIDSNESSTPTKRPTTLTTLKRIGLIEAIELWQKASEKWNLKRHRGSKAVEKGYNAYIDTKEDIERVKTAITSLTIKRPTDFYCNGRFFDLAWLFRKVNNKRQPCDNIEMILEGRIFEEMKMNEFSVQDNRVNPAEIFLQAAREGRYEDE